MDRLGVRIAIEDELHKTGEVDYNDYAGLCSIAMFRVTLQRLQNAGYSLTYQNVKGQPAANSNCVTCKLVTKPAQRVNFYAKHDRETYIKNILFSTGVFYINDWDCTRIYLSVIISKIRHELLKQNKTIAPILGGRGRAAIGYRLVQLSGGNKKPS
jgi:hypothetical protein